jgi:UDP-N-acetylmuramate--alanine ligase
MDYKKAYFIGIGGIGMSALAQLFLDHGTKVSGSDRDASPVTELLEKKGIRVAIGQRAENVPRDAEVIVYSDSVPADNPERARARELNIPEFSYFEALGEVSKGKRTIAVAGTHGKTTTTGMLAKILKDAGASPTAVIGSIVKDFGSNYLHGDSDIFVVEADEYRAHLLHLSPQVLVINNLEWDHTDFYPSLEAMQETFQEAVGKVPADGAIITDPNNKNIAPLLAHAKARVVDYTKEPSTKSDLVLGKPAYTLRLPGGFNQMNARAAAAAARATFPSIENTTIYGSVSSFQGTWRRFEYKGKTANGADVYDDYAHHPTAVRETLRALREVTPYGCRKVSPRGKIIVAFHPHLYSRTRDLLDEFALAFKDADRVLIAPIYAAREVDDGSISSEILASRIRAAGTDAVALNFDAIQAELASADASTTIMTMGAGDIYKVADALVSHK